MKIRKKINPFIVGYILGLALLAFLGYGIGGYTAQRELKNNTTSTSTNQNFATDVAFVDLPRMNLTLSSNDVGTGRIRIDMSLEVQKKDLARVADYQPIIMDHLIGFVRQRHIEDMRSPNAAPNLRKELRDEVNNVTHSTPVMDVIFRQFVIM